MGVNSPSEMPERFVALFNARDRRGLLDLYDEGAMLTIDGETAARGKAAIGEMMAPMLDGPLKVAGRCASCHENGELAMVRTDWTFTAPDGSVAMSGASAELLRRGADGSWRFVIDDATFSSRPRQG